MEKRSERPSVAVANLREPNTGAIKQERGRYAAVQSAAVADDPAGVLCDYLKVYVSVCEHQPDFDVRALRAAEERVRDGGLYARYPNEVTAASKAAFAEMVRVSAKHQSYAEAWDDAMFDLTAAWDRAQELSNEWAVLSGGPMTGTTDYGVVMRARARSKPSLCPSDANYDRFLTALEAHANLLILDAYEAKEVEEVGEPDSKRHCPSC